MKRLAGWAITAVLAAAGGASAQEGSRPPSLRLVQDEIQALYPPAAKARGVEGQVRLSCEVAGGALSKCAVISEDPAGEGFAAAALTLARRYESQPKAGATGWPIGATVRFQLPKPETVRTDRAVYTAPMQVAGPSMDRRYAAWPRAARFSGVEGWANLWCAIALDGTARDCSIANESRRGLGFGEAALSLAGDFRFQPGRKGAAPAAMSALVPVNFRCDARCRSFEAAAGAEALGRGWLTAPTPAEVRAAYPAAARARGVEGQVRLDCAAGRNGRLSDCRVVAESRPGEGFGAAALKLADRFSLASGFGPRVSLSVAFDAGNGRVESLWEAELAPSAVMSSPPIPKVTMQARCEVAADGRLRACAVLGLDPANAPLVGRIHASLDRLTASTWTEAGHSTIGSIVEFEFSTGSRTEPVVLAEPIAAPRVPPGVIDYRPQTLLPLKVDLARYYPDRAQRMEASGRVVVECTALVEGRPTGCRVASETPTDYGFGDAALRVVSRYRYMPGSVEGEPLEVSAREPLRIPMVFAVPQ